MSDSRGGNQRIPSMQDDAPVYATIAAARAEGLTGPRLTERVWERHGTTCAMLALDSSGMTRISRSCGIVHFLNCYLEMRRLIEPLLAGSTCLGWRSFADNLFAEFCDADAALVVARQMHRVVRENRLMLTETEPYRLCIGIGQGRVLKNGHYGVMGDEMNLVAKLAEDVAAGDETLLTESGYKSLRAAAAIAVEPIRLTISDLTITYYRLCEE
jgi:class 3 adenylate cyclase